MAEKDQLDQLPAPVRQQLGDAAELALTFDLSKGMKLGSEDPAEVLSNIASQGYHIQMPRSIDEMLETIAQDSVSASSEDKNGTPE